MMSVSVSVFVVLSLYNSSENLILLQRRWVFRRTGLFQQILKENIKNIRKILEIQKNIKNVDYKPDPVAAEVDVPHNRTAPKNKTADAPARLP